MSRINDALKRAEAAQQDNRISVDGLRLRPADPKQTGRGIGLTAPIIFALVTLLGLLLLWQIRQKHARHNAQPGTITNPLAETPSAASVPAVSEPIKPTDSTMAMTNLMPAEPDFKLQAILFSPHNSTAMINGQTVREGDHVSGYRVAAIDKRTVTLVSATETNIVKLTPQ